jgi:hypothetical protein
MMNSEMLSYLVRYWHDVQADATHLQVTQVDTGEEVQLRDGTFLLRIFTDANASTLRCLIRHLASGREAYIQSGRAMQSFVQACLLAQPSPPPGAPEQKTRDQDTGDTGKEP